jgi:glycosyltransferase involved in cell wall biosynthesis
MCERLQPGQGRLLVVSHPAVVNVNQEVYRELVGRGWDVTIVLPSRWRHEYSQAMMGPETLTGLEDALRPTPVLMAGHPQRHVYLASCRALCMRARPDVAFVEAEPFSLSATQWSFALGGLGVPFGVQCAENIDRGLPLPIRRLRSRVLRDAAFVAARSESAARLARAWGARGEVDFAPHAVPAWELAAGRHGLTALRPDASGKSDAPPAETPCPTGTYSPRRTTYASEPGASDAPVSPFRIGYAGRLVESKGLTDLLAAVRRLQAPVEMLLIGAGELRAQLEDQPIPGSRVRVLDGLAHEEMASGYAQLDVLVLPSRTTPTWKEQFGRVIVEALWCGVPVVGSDSGEIPWLIGLTGGGLVFPEGDSEALARQLARLRAEPELRRELAERGRRAVERLFSVPGATDPLEGLLIRARRPDARRARDGEPRFAPS